MVQTRLVRAAATEYFEYQTESAACPERATTASMRYGRPSRVLSIARRIAGATWSVAITTSPRTPKPDATRAKSTSEFPS